MYIFIYIYIYIYIYRERELYVCICVCAHSYTNINTGTQTLKAMITLPLFCECPGSREWLPSETPFQFCVTCFGRVFGPAHVRISYVFSLRSFFFLQRQKMCTKDPNVRLSYRSSLRRGARTSFTFFWDGFSDPRV